MNPLLKLLLKQVEDNSVMLEKYMKASEKMEHWETKIQVNAAFDHLHNGLFLVKDILKELL